MDALLAEDVSASAACCAPTTPGNATHKGRASANKAALTILGVSEHAMESPTRSAETTVVDKVGLPF